MSSTACKFQFYPYQMPTQWQQDSFYESMDIDMGGKQKIPQPQLQLKPKLNATPKRWSCELREKILAQAKHSSGSDEEHAAINNTTITIKAFVQQPMEQLKPKLNATPKRWSCEICEKVLAQAKRNFAANKPFENNINLQNTYIKSEETLADVSSSTGHIDNVAAAYPQNENTNHAADSATVREKIQFFNRLTKSFEPKTQVNSKFLHLLKNTKEANKATVAPKITVTTSTDTPIKTECSSASSGRISLNLEELVNPFLAHTFRSPVHSSNSLHYDTATSSFSSMLTSTPFASKSKNTLHMNKSSSEMPEQEQHQQQLQQWRDPRHTNRSSNSASSVAYLQRKNSLRRKSSMEKSRSTISRQSSGRNNDTGTRPQMHAMMEDLSLVLPVRLRIAEYERKISMYS